jgi:hypothetical protein
MATTTFAVSNAAFSLSGQFLRYPIATSRKSIQYKGNNSQIDFTATGTDCTLRALVTTTGSNWLQVSVDGGAYTNLAMSGMTINTWTDLTLFTGLSDTAHTVSVRLNIGGGSVVYIDFLTAISLTGAAPAIAMTTGFGEIWDVWGGEFLTYAQSFGGLVSSAFNGYGNPPLALCTSFPDQGIRFWGRATDIKVWSINNTAHSFKLMIDGVASSLGKISGNSSGTYTWITMGTGIDNTVDHMFELVQVNSSTWSFGQVMLVGGTGLRKTISPSPKRGVVANFGDSKSIG